MAGMTTTHMTPPIPGLVADHHGVPLHVAHVWQHHLPTTRCVFEGDLPVVPFGYRWEVDLHQLPPVAAESLAGWFTVVKQFWRLGGPRTTPSFTTVRTDVAYVEVANSVDRADLGWLVDDLVLIPGLAPVVREATSSHPDWDTVAALVTPLGGTVTPDGNTTRITTHIPLSTAVPHSLGGLPLIGQTSRELVMAVNHAKWRNRRARRLTKVSMKVTDAWPRPVHMPN